MQNASEQERLLCAIMAVQLGLVEVDEVIGALNESGVEGSAQLVQWLRHTQKITAGQSEMLLKILEVHLAAHRGDVHESLASLSTNDTVKRAAEQITDRDSDLTVDFGGGDSNAEAVSTDAAGRFSPTPQVDWEWCLLRATCSSSVRWHSRNLRKNTLMIQPSRIDFCLKVR